MQSLFFTKAAAQRLLPFATKIEALRVFAGSIQVTYKTKNGRCSTFLSKKAFYSDFTTFRLEGAKNCTVERWSVATYTSRYSVYSKGGENTRIVDTYGMPNCSCPDYEKQQHHLGRAMVGCKHIMAVMGQLGYGSLQDYRDAKAAKESKKRCTCCNGSGNIRDWNGNITEQCYECRGSGYKKLVESVELANFDLIGGGWDEPHLVESHGDFIDMELFAAEYSDRKNSDVNQDVKRQGIAATKGKKKIADPFGGFNF